MNRAEFLARLRELLSDITEAEREEAICYYEDYFNDAGVENEASVIESLGSPEKVAATIKDGLNDGEGLNGEFSERGFTNRAYDNREEVAERTYLSEEVKGKQKRDISGGMWIVIIILCLFGLPILVPLVIGLLSTIFGLLCAAAALAVALAASGIAIIVTGFALMAAAIPALIHNPLVGILLFGAGLILGGVGVLLTILFGWIIVKALPLAVRGLANFCRKPFERKRG